MESGQGHAFLVGANYAISRWVESPASKARIAHLVSGFRDSYGQRNSMLLSRMPMFWYNNNEPDWWPNNTEFADQWKTMANNTDPSTSRGLAFWADVCASYCVRRHDDDSEFMELDFTVVDQGKAHNNGRCSCYAYQDSDLRSAHANKTSHVPPDDSRALEFLSRHLKIGPNQPNNTHVYTMKRDVGIGLFVPELQSTIYHRKLWEEHIDADLGTLMNIADTSRAYRSNIVTFYSIKTKTICLSRCAIDAVSRQVAIKTVRFHSVDHSCFCFDNSLFQWGFDPIWNRDPGSVAEWYDVEYCEFVRPDEVRDRSRTTHACPETSPHSTQRLLTQTACSTDERLCGPRTAHCPRPRAIAKARPWAGVLLFHLGRFSSHTTMGKVRHLLMSYAAKSARPPSNVRTHTCFQKASSI